MRARLSRVKYHHYRLRYGGSLLNVYHLPFAGSHTALVRGVGPRSAHPPAHQVLVPCGGVMVAAQAGPGDWSTVAERPPASTCSAREVPVVRSHHRQPLLPHHAPKAELLAQAPGH